MNSLNFWVLVNSLLSEPNIWTKFQNRICVSDLFCSTHSHLYVEQEMLKNELKDFGCRVKALREQQGLTKTQLAFEMGTGEKYIRELEKGNINITFNNLIKLANCLNIKPEILFIK